MVVADVRGVLHPVQDAEVPTLTSFSVSSLRLCCEVPRSIAVYRKFTRRSTSTSMASRRSILKAGPSLIIQKRRRA